MIIFVQGEPKSGKSICVEQLLFKKRVLYVGTLLDDPDFQDIIASHKLRRPDYWGLYECTGDIRRDVDGVLKQKDVYDATLIDGLTYYIRQAVYLRAIPEYTILRKILWFLRSFAASETDLYLIDHYCKDDGRLETEFIQFYHDLAYHYSDQVFKYANGKLIEWDVNRND